MAKLENVNTRDVTDAIALACRTMSSVFNADDDNRPFFGSQVWPEARLSFSWAHSEAHVPGRHLNAMLNAEDVAGVGLDETAVDKHAQAAFYSYSGPVALPLNRAAVDGPLINFIPHNIREGFHALYALAAYRSSSRARSLAEASIAAIDRLWDPERGWDYATIEGPMGLTVQRSTFIVGLARSIGPLVKYYRATGYAPALELAARLKDKAVAEFYLPDGGYDRQTFGTHTHSTTCTMSGLAQLADLTGDMPLLERVRAFYDNGLWDIRDGLGWVIENSADEALPDRGECNNTGDIVETALILGRHGYASYFEDAERIVRGHLLPSQLRDRSFITDSPNPHGIDGLRDVADRHVGAYGFPAPYGHHPLGADSISFNMDIVGGATGSLCEVLRECVRSDAAGHWVTMAFDRSTPEVDVRSPYPSGTLEVRVKKPGPLWLRLPSWLNSDWRSPASDNEVHGNYLLVSRPSLNRWMRFDWPLAGGNMVLGHRTHAIRVRLQGDETVAMDSHGAELTYFDPYD